MTNLEKELSKLETELRKMETANEFLKASFYINKTIIPFLIKNNSNAKHKTKLQFYKSKLREVSKKSISEMQSVEFETPVDWKRIDEYLKFYTSSKDLNTLMYRLGSMVPKNEQVLETSKKTMPLTYLFASRQSIDDDWNVNSWENDEWYYNMYRVHQQLSDTFLEMIFLEVIANRILTEEWLIKFISSKPLFLKYSELLKFAHWIHTYFTGDYVATLHILIPLFEKVILNVSAQVGIDTIALLRWKEWIWDKTVWKDFLNSPEFQEKWWVNLGKQISFILYDNKGYNLRHSLAHWEIDYSECNFQSWTLIIWLYIAIATRLKVQIKENE